MRQPSHRELEEAYKQVFSGTVEPDVMYMNGAHVKAMAKYCGYPEPTKDIDGAPLYDGLVYAVCSSGIIPVNDNGERVRVVREK